MGLSACQPAHSPQIRLGEVEGMAPSSWSQSEYSKAGVDYGWVQNFGDSRLNQLVKKAVESHPEMQIMAERVHRAEKYAQIAGAASKVQSNIGLSGNRKKTVFVNFPFEGSQTANTYGIDWKVNWEPDIWGRVRAGVGSKIADAQAAEMDRQAAEASMAGNICKAWFALAEAKEQLQLAERALRIRQQTVEAVSERFELNLGAEGGGASQLRLAQTEVATATATVAQWQGQVDAAKRSLQVLAGDYPDGSIKGRSMMPKLPKRPPVGLPSELLLRRPDILAAERRYAAAGKSIQEARLALFPSFKLTSGAGTTTNQLTKILSSKFGIWSLGADVSYAILTGGRVKNEIALRNSSQREALANLQRTVLQAFGEVEQSLAADGWLAKRIVALEKAKILAADAARSADEDYAMGNGDVLTVLNAKLQLITISSNIISLRRAQLDNRVNLHHGLGGAYLVKKSK